RPRVGDGAGGRPVLAVGHARPGARHRAGPAADRGVAAAAPVGRAALPAPRERRRAVAVGVAGVMQQSNTFNPPRTHRRAFAAQGLSFGPALVEEWRDAHHEVGGFLESAQALGFEPVPLVMAWATPAGPVTDDVFDEVTGRLVEALRRE